MKSCWRIGTVIDFSPDALHHCCTYTAAKYPDVLSFSGPKVCNFTGGPFPLEEYLHSIKELNKLNNTDNPPCKDCDYLLDSPSVSNFTNIKIINVNNYKLCNVRCIYCTGDNNLEQFKNTYNLTETLQDMLDRNIITTETIIGWGGGEPTLCKDLDSIIQFVIDNDLKLLLNTNATIYSEKIAYALSTDKISLRISPDSGNAETYKRVKGKDFHKKVWENIAKYIAVNSNEVELKYVVMPENWEKEDFILFAKKCISVDVQKSIVIMPELTAFWQTDNCYPYIDKMIELSDILTEYGLSPYIPDDAFNKSQKDYLDYKINFRQKLSELEQANNVITVLQTHVSGLETHVSGLESSNDAKASYISELEISNNEKSYEQEQAHKYISELITQINNYETSASWRITKPFRRFKNFIKK